MENKVSGQIERVNGFISTLSGFALLQI